jgi:hypothetical protein
MALQLSWEMNLLVMLAAMMIDELFLIDYRMMLPDSYGDGKAYLYSSSLFDERL